MVQHQSSSNSTPFLEYLLKCWKIPNSENCSEDFLWYFFIGIRVFRWIPSDRNSEDVLIPTEFPKKFFRKKIGKVQQRGLVSTLLYCFQVSIIKSSCATFVCGNLKLVHQIILETHANNQQSKTKFGFLYGRSNLSIAWNIINAKLIKKIKVTIQTKWNTIQQSEVRCNYLSKHTESKINEKMIETDKNSNSNRYDYLKCWKIFILCAYSDSFKKTFVFFHDNYL